MQCEHFVDFQHSRVIKGFVKGKLHITAEIMRNVFGLFCCTANKLMLGYQEFQEFQVR
jgi:hypothetical protein